MRTEERLYVIAREAVGEEFPSFGAIADKVIGQSPPEFSYNRLRTRHTMQVNSVVPYISLAYLIGIIRPNGNNNYECILDEEPTREGFDTIITRRAIECLEQSGFRKDNFRRNVKKLLRSANPVVPTPKEIFGMMTLTLPEIQFIQLINIGGVRAHFGFTFVTRRIMLPTEEIAE
jgi:hypothetical protein